jgi:hypothetical protein
MHEYYRPERHSKLCNEKYDEMIQCRKDHYMKRLFGFCNKYEEAMNGCFHREFRKKVKADRERDAERIKKTELILQMSHDDNEEYWANRRRNGEMITESPELSAAWLRKYDAKMAKKQAK